MGKSCKRSWTARTHRYKRVELDVIDGGGVGVVLHQVLRVVLVGGQVHLGGHLQLHRCTSHLPAIRADQEQVAIVWLEGKTSEIRILTLVKNIVFSSKLNVCFL